MSPSIASSPVIGTFAESAKAGRASPAPASAARPASSRARQNSIQSNLENGRPRPPSSASNKPNGAATQPIEPTTQTNGARTASNETKSPKDTVPAAEAETPKVEPETAILPPPIPTLVTKKEGTPKAADEGEVTRDATPGGGAITTTTVTTKSGRASKPSTPALANFPDNARSRSSRSSDATATVKRSHKKGASAAAAVAAARALASQRADNDINTNSTVDDEDDIDENEPRYCFCNRVSFGEMVGCDGPNCKREWFHLECVGLKVAPKSNGKPCVPLIFGHGMS